MYAPPPLRLYFGVAICPPPLFQRWLFSVQYGARNGYAWRFYLPLLRGTARWRASPITPTLRLLLSVVVPPPPFPPPCFTSEPHHRWREKNNPAPLLYACLFFRFAVLGHTLKAFLLLRWLPAVSHHHNKKCFFLFADLSQTEKMKS